MPKMKTKRAAAKRFSITATGKFKCKKAGVRHLLTSKSRDLKRGKNHPNYVHPTNMDSVRACLPYA